MISRDDYVGPITKSAEAMFARVERAARRRDHGQRADLGRTRVAPILPIRAALNALGLTVTTLRHWEDAGIVAFERRKGQRLVDEASLERLRMVARLRREGFSVREIVWISDLLPPGVDAMERALAARLSYRQVTRDGAVARVKRAGKTI